ncbi:MAG: hypothetical protein JO316_03510 [Abitibacteriaceae bacterium]|nr:hypothetical protein [Abditibacteriaceae bacterium]
MADSNGSSVAAAVKPDGFVDYYQLLGVSSNTDSEQLQTRINELYSEAQANRNHRQMEKRREYETLLEMLPQARNILLDDDKRARYDAYATQVQRGIATTSFATFLSQLSNRSMADPDRVDVLGVAETPSTRPDRPKSGAAKKKGPSERARTSLIGTAISVIIFFFIAVVTYAVKKDMGLAVLIGALVGVIAWFVTHRPSDKIST